jgi:rhodanese-related sulfurtransferase
MAKFKIWMLSIFTISVLLVSCGKTVDESLVLAEYLESADSPIDVAAIAKYITAGDVQALNATLGAYIIDIRSAEDFGKGHIAGAVNVPATDVIAHLDGMDVSGYEKVVVACYTGQTAAFVASLARLAGHNAFSLKWGMSSWNATTAGPLQSNSKNTYVSQLETTDNPKAEAGDLPILETGHATGAEILDARISEVNTSGFDGVKITAETVIGAPENYYIINYWPIADYNLGHLPGAIQYTPNDDLLSTSFLNTLPTDKTIVVYCYTGQTSAFMAAYLKVLGYDAKSLLFGVNGMATDWAAENGLTHWSNDYISGYELVTE